MLFGNENKANDHTQQFIYDEKRILPNCLQENYRDSNRSYGVFGAERDYQLYEITANNQQ